MSVDTIVTLGKNRRYYLVDETYQNNTRYFLGTRLNEEDLPTTESEIFEELVMDKATYLTPVIDDEKLNNLAAIFIAKFKKLMEQDYLSCFFVYYFMF